MQSIDRSTQRVVVTGSSGLIGASLVGALAAAGHPVTRLVRNTPKAGDARWDPESGTIDAAALEGAWAVVHLAGEGIADKKWTGDHKRKVLDSRVLGTTLLAKTLASLNTPPTAFLSGSAIGYYGNRGDERLDEASPRGAGFLADVVHAWEGATAEAEAVGIRTAHLRTGIVLSTTGGALKQQLLPFKLGLGGRLGTGRQYLPWITLADEVSAIQFIVDNNTIRGPINLVGPNPVTNDTFTKALGAALHRPTLLPIPLFPIRAKFGKEMVEEMLLSSARVLPTVLEQAGFRFSYTDLGAALGYLLESHV